MRVAFDPAKRRVWRICSSCDEWNLLGPEAAAAALPELEARFAALTATGEVRGEFAPVRVGAVELLRLGVRGDADSAFALRLDDEVRHREKMFRGAVIFGAVAISAMAVVEYFILGFDPWQWLTFVVMFAISAPVTLLDRRLAGGCVAASSWAITIAVLTLGLVAIFHHFGWGRVSDILFGMALVTPIMLLFLAGSRRWISIAQGYTTTGRLVGDTSNELRNLTIDWDRHGRAMIRDMPGGGVVAGDAVYDLYHFIWPRRPGVAARKIPTLSTTMAARAADLPRAAGGMRGLRRALDGYRRDRDGRIAIVDLPWIYLVAIDIAMTIEMQRDDSRIDALRARSAEASRIADEADRLLREQGESASVRDDAPE